MSRPLSGPTRMDVAEAADEAFGLLANSNRIEILRALWEAHDPINPSRVPFSEILERVNVDDPGRLNYHLNKLKDHFIQRTEEGYELREAGRRIIRVIISGTAIADPFLESTEIDVDCIFCGEAAEIRYEEGWSFLQCSHCNVQCLDGYPDGVICMHALPPSGVIERTPNEIHAVDMIWSKHRVATVADGVCPDCAGRIQVTSIRTCESHHPNQHYDKVCESCNSLFKSEVVNTCMICDSIWKLPIPYHLAAHPAVVSFYYAHGINFDIGRFENRDLMHTFREERISEDPIRIQITIPLDDVELQVTVDEEMKIIDVKQESASWVEV